MRYGHVPPTSPVCCVGDLFPDHVWKRTLNVTSDKIPASPKRVISSERFGNHPCILTLEWRV
jgi:hypothetical protein